MLELIILALGVISVVSGIKILSILKLRSHCCNAINSTKS